MKKWFCNLSTSYKTALLTTLLVVIGLLSTLFGYFVKLPELPNGMILGGLVGILSYVLMGLVEPYDEKRQKPTLTIVVIILRFVLVAVTVLLSALLYYKSNCHIFNLFAVAGSYLLSLVAFIIVNLMEKSDV